MRGGAGRDTITPETFRNKGTDMVHTSFRLFRSQRAAQVREMKFSKAIQETGFALQDGRGRRFHDVYELIQVLQRLTAKRHPGLPRARTLSGGTPLVLTALERWKVLVPGKEAVLRSPRPLGYRASRVGEFKESDDWSPLLLLLR